MSSEFTQIAEQVKNLSKVYKSVIEMGEFLERVGALDNLKGELEAQIAKRRIDTVTAEEELQAARQRVADAQREAEQILSDARVRAGALLEQEQAHADAIVGEAKAEAAKVKQSIDAAVGAAQTEVYCKQLEAKRVDAHIADANAVLIRINEAIAEARAKLGV